MTESNIKELINIIARTFSLSSTEISLEKSSSDIGPWDSLGQLLLINNIEDHYGITLELEEIFSIITLEDIYNILVKRGKIK